MGELLELARRFLKDTGWSATPEPSATRTTTEEGAPFPAARPSAEVEIPPVSATSMLDQRQPAVLPEDPNVPLVVTRVTSVQLFTALEPELFAAPRIGLDIETTGLDPLTDRVRLIQLAIPGRVVILDCFHVDPCVIRPLLERTPRLIGHNLKFDLRFLLARGLPLPTGDRLFDTMLAAQLLAAGTEAFWDCGLAAVTQRELARSLDKTHQTADWSQELTDAHMEYAAADAAILLPLAHRLETALEHADLTHIATREMRALPALTWLEHTGVPFQADQWKTIADLITTNLQQVEAQLAEAAQHSINWRSSAQVLRLLQARGHQVKDTKEATLRPLAQTDALARLFLEHREYSKRASTYGPDFLRHVHPVTGRIHASFMQIGAATGRMSCSKPNLQNIPRHKDYRAAFRAPVGRVLVKADCNQIELRIAAQISQDPVMMAAFTNGEDLHTRTAAEVLGVELTGVTPAQRQLAKSLNFGLLYGMGARTLRDYADTHYGVSLTEEEAQRLRERFFHTYRGLRHWHRNQPDRLLDTRTLERRRRLQVERFTEKLNSPVQGTGADIIKLALARLYEDKVKIPSAAPVLVVHDEIVVECNEEDAQLVVEWLRHPLEVAAAEVLADIPVPVNVKFAQDWSGTA